MSGSDFYRNLLNAGTLLNAFGQIASRNNNENNYSHRDEWNGCISHRPITYSPPIYVPSPVYNGGCYGNQNQNWNDEYRPTRRHKYRHEGYNRDWNCNYPRNYPDYNGNVSTYPVPQTGGYPNYNPAYPQIVSGGNGQQTANILLAGRELEFDQNTNTVTSHNPSTGEVKSFTALNNPYNNSFTDAEKQQIRNLQPVTRDLGNEQVAGKSRAKIYFYPSSDRTRIENVVVTYDNQEVLRVGNLAALTDRGLNIPTPNGQYNNPNQQSQPYPQPMTV